MRRTLGVSAASVCALLLAAASFQACSPPPVEESSPATAEPAAVQPTLHWEEIAPGIEVIRLWNYFEPPEKTQTALLRLTTARELELEENATKFVNDHRIFDPDVVSDVAELSVQVREDAPEDKADLLWRVMINHWPDCRGRGASFLDWTPPLDSASSEEE